MIVSQYETIWSGWFLPSEEAKWSLWAPTSLSPCSSVWINLKIRKYAKELTWSENSDHVLWASLISYLCVKHVDCLVTYWHVTITCGKEPVWEESFLLIWLKNWGTQKLMKICGRMIFWMPMGVYLLDCIKCPNLLPLFIKINLGIMCCRWWDT